jgi:hypothetical protein
MLQVHNMMPHYHVEKVAKIHSHKHEDQHHHHNSESDDSLPLSKTDHSAEFGNALVKPGNSKYQITQPKPVPLLPILFGDQKVTLYSDITPKLSLKLQDHLIPPAPYLQGISFRGPPLFV